MSSVYSFFLVLVFLHQFEGIGAESHNFFRAGEDVTLPCQRAENRDSKCSEVRWFYYDREGSFGVDRVTGGRVMNESPGSSRVSLTSNCSLIIHNVTEDDTGRYYCRLFNQDTWNTIIHLGTLRVSRAPPGSGESPDVPHVTVQCSVSRYSRRCADGRILWSDHQGEIRTNITRNNCVSYLTVERRRSRTFTCRYLNAKNEVLISADYTPETDDIHRFSRAGGDTTLPCDRLKHLGPTSCSSVNWIHYKDRSSSSSPTYKVSDGRTTDSRLRLNSDCSLTVQNVSAQDSGSFLCEQLESPDSGTSVFLSVLTVSPVQPDLDQNQKITLRCTLWRYTGFICSDKNFIWLDQKKQLLSEEKKNCVSDLELQSPQNRTFTCQYQEKGKVLVSAEYILQEKIRNSGTGDSQMMIYIISGATGSVLLLLLIVAAVVFFKLKSKSSPETTEQIYAEPQQFDPVVEPESNLTYAMINHKKPTPQKRIAVDDAVTYSAVTIKKKDDSNHSAIYSTVNKT